MNFFNQKEFQIVGKNYPEENLKRVLSDWKLVSLWKPLRDIKQKKKKTVVHHSSKQTYKPEQKAKKIYRMVL